MIQPPAEMLKGKLRSQRNKLLPTADNGWQSTPLEPLYRTKSKIQQNKD
jgi:hypothetical protein